MWPGWRLVRHFDWKTPLMTNNDFVRLGAEKRSNFFDGSGRLLSPLNAHCPVHNARHEFSMLRGAPDGFARVEGTCGHRFEVPLP